VQVQSYERSSDPSIDSLLFKVAYHDTPERISLHSLQRCTWVPSCLHPLAHRMRLLLLFPVRPPSFHRHTIQHHGQIMTFICYPGCDDLIHCLELALGNQNLKDEVKADLPIIHWIWR
jgi:hypothetical protein